MTSRPSRPAARWLRSARREAKTKPASSGERSVAPERNAPPVWAADLDMNELSRLVGVPVNIDKTGWLRDTIDLVFDRTADGILPTEVKVGATVSAADAQKLGNVRELCERYSRAINQLKRISSDELMEKIMARQEERMGYRRVKYFALTREIEFLNECLKEVMG